MGANGMIWPTSEPFEEVLQRSREADHQALSLLYRRFLPVVYRYILVRIGDPHYAEDLTSDTFFAMVEGITGTRASDELSFAAWLLGIARNKVAMHFRRLRTRVEVWQDELASSSADIQAVGDEDDPLTIITARESWATVADALARLTEEQRTVVLYRCVLGFSTEDVATLLEKRPKAIRALQSRALASLARHLGIEKQVRRREPEHAKGRRQMGASSHVL